MIDKFCDAVLELGDRMNFPLKVDEEEVEEPDKNGTERLSCLESIAAHRDYKNLPRLCKGTGKSTRVSKICSPRRGLPSRGRCKSLTRGWISLSLYKVVVDYFSPTALNPHNKTPLFAFKNHFKTFSAEKTAPTWVNHDVTSLY